MTFTEWFYQWTLLLGLLLCIRIQGSAQIVLNDSSITEDIYDGLEINGLVVDETITKVGRDFYELFYGLWEAPMSNVSYTLIIRERPMTGFGSQIALYINETEVFTQVLQPRYDVIEAVAKYAVDLTYSYLQHYESLVLQLGNEDQYGSGIY